MRRFGEIVTDISLLQGAKSVYSPVEGGWIGFKRSDAVKAISAAKASPFIVTVGSISRPHVAKSCRGRFVNLVEIDHSVGVVDQSAAPMPWHHKAAQQRGGWDTVIKIKNLWIIDDLPHLSDVMGSGGTGLMQYKHGSVQTDPVWIDRMYDALKGWMMVSYPFHDGTEEDLEKLIVLSGQ